MGFAFCPSYSPETGYAIPGINSVILGIMSLGIWGNGPEISSFPGMAVSISHSPTCKTFLVITLCIYGFVSIRVDIYAISDLCCITSCHVVAVYTFSPIKLATSASKAQSKDSPKTIGKIRTSRKRFKMKRKKRIPSQITLQRRTKTTKE